GEPEPSEASVTGPYGVQSLPLMLSDRSLKPTRARVPHSAMLAVASSPDRRGGAAPLTAFHESRVREKTIHSAASRGRHRSLSGDLRGVSACLPGLPASTAEHGHLRTPKSRCPTRRR